jgi:hypothetical protein
MILLLSAGGKSGMEDCRPNEVSSNRSDKKCTARPPVEEKL